MRGDLVISDGKLCVETVANQNQYLLAFASAVMVVVAVAVDFTVDLNSHEKKVHTEDW